MAGPNGRHLKYRGQPATLHVDEGFPNLVGLGSMGLAKGAA
jgi:hypothetical protein